MADELGLNRNGTTPTARKPHRNWAGYVTERRNLLSGGHNVLVRAGPAGLDPSGGTWVTICDVHGTLCNHKNRALAYGHLPLSEWCEECMAIREAARKAMLPPARTKT